MTRNMAPQLGDYASKNNVCNSTFNPNSEKMYCVRRFTYTTQGFITFIFILKSDKMAGEVAP